MREASSRPAWRLLSTEPVDGATNMAIDEALWRGRQAGTSPPTLRFFAWSPPTVSLGYGQPLDDVDLVACRALGIGLVRRLTGGSAIYHDGPERELTYSVVASTEDLGVAGGLLETYRWIGVALRRGLNSLGAGAELVPVVKSNLTARLGRRGPSPPTSSGSDEGPTPAFCFARTGRYEIEIGGRKVVGSAQRRQRACFLQHGSVLLDVDGPRVRRVFPTTLDPLATLTTLERALGRRPGWHEVADALAAGFEAEHGLTLKPDGFSTDELARVDDLIRTRYATDGWLAGAP